MKRKLLLHSDSLCAPTGFASVAKLIHAALDDWDVTQIGINHPGPLVQHKTARVIDANFGGDVWGFNLLRDMLRGKDEFDLVMIIQDLHVAAQWKDELNNFRQSLALQQQTPCPVLFHFPVDGPVVGHIEHMCLAPSMGDLPGDLGVLSAMDQVVLPTDWANDILLPWGQSERFPVIPHSVDTSVFYPLPEEERQEARARIFGIKDPDTLAVLWLGVNTDRKDAFTAISSIPELKKLGVNAKFHFHTNPIAHGHDMRVQTYFHKVSSLDMSVSDPSLIGCDPSALNTLYNAADCLLFTSRREGFGIPMIEAMAAGTPVVAPNYGPFAEVLDKGRLGYLHETLGQICWIRDDNRGPSWQSSPAAVAQTLELLAEERKTRPAAHQARIDAALAEVRAKYSTEVVKEHWREFIYRTLMEARKCQ